MLKTFKQMLNVFVHLNKCIWFSHKCCPKTCVISGEQMAPHISKQIYSQKLDIFLSIADAMS